MRYVIQMGRIYRLTEGMYRQLLKDGMKNGTPEELTKYKATAISVANNITDWSEGDYTNEYENLEGNSSKLRKKKKA